MSNWISLLIHNSVDKYISNAIEYSADKIAYILDKSTTIQDKEHKQIEKILCDLTHGMGILLPSNSDESHMTNIIIQIRK